MSVILVDPSGYTIHESLNPLTSPTAVIDIQRATTQHERMRQRLAAAGAIVSIIPASTDFPDQVYVSNAGLIIGTTLILSRFAVAPRRGEELRLRDWVRTTKPDISRIYHLPNERGLYFEGQGSCRWSHGGTHLWIGYGAGRTSKRGAEVVASLVRRISQKTITTHLLHIVDARTYHLDLCFCPLPNGRVLWHAESFSEASRDLIKRTFGPAAVQNLPPRFLYGCNAVPIGDTLIVPQVRDPEWRTWIRAKSGMRSVITVNVSEFEKAGGSISCMVLLGPKHQ
jgi:N-dimethylarginine dimethylaminohydrolase